jgi:hypothetical protein
MKSVMQITGHHAVPLGILAIADERAMICRIQVDDGSSRASARSLIRQFRNLEIHHP